MNIDRRHLRDAHVGGIENHSQIDGSFALEFYTFSDGGELAKQHLIHLHRDDIDVLAYRLWQYLKDEQRWLDETKKRMRGE